MKERIQKLISSAGLMSRRAAEEAIVAGRVTRNGAAVVLGDKADPLKDRIEVDGKPLPRVEERVYLMLNKPRAYVTTLHDEKGRRNVTELVDLPGVRVYPVGRLDMYSEGLLLMTNDGEFANRIMHPSHEIEKTYRTWVSGENLEKSVHILRRPMEIDGYTVHPAGVDIVQSFPGGALLSVTIREGRNRQIRKMCEKAGLKVSRLLRISEGGVELGELKSGCWRHLTPEELDLLLGKEGD